MRKATAIVLGIAVLAGMTWRIWPPPQVATGAPNIVSAPGLLVDGTNFVITGTNFGTNTLDQEWIGGANGQLESKAVGTEMRAWTGVSIQPSTHQNFPGTWCETLSSATTRPVIANDRSHSYNKSIKCYVDHAIAGSFQSGFDFMWTHRFTECYATWWTYWNPMSDGIATHGSNNCNGPQWKMWRLNDGANRVNDQPGEIWLGSNYLIQLPTPPLPSCPTPRKTQQRVEINSANPSCNQGIVCSPSIEPSEDQVVVNSVPVGCCNQSDSFTPTNFTTPPATTSAVQVSTVPDDSQHWVRWEVHAKQSTYDVKDGSVQVWISCPELGINTTTLADFTPATGHPICTHRNLDNDYHGNAPWNKPTPQNWQWFVWQNFNEQVLPGPVGVGKTNWWFDDAYMSVDNGQARVELGDANIYANCTHREIQVPSAWSGISITAAANLGGFVGNCLANQTLYLYVVDQSGAVSNAYPVSVSCFSPPNMPSQGGGDLVVAYNDSATAGGAIAHTITGIPATVAAGDTFTATVHFQGNQSITAFRGVVRFGRSTGICSSSFEPIAWWGATLNGVKVSRVDLQPRNLNGTYGPGLSVDDATLTCGSIPFNQVGLFQWGGSALDLTGGVDVLKVRFKALTPSFGVACGTDCAMQWSAVDEDRKIYVSTGGGATFTGPISMDQSTNGDITTLSPLWTNASVSLDSITGGTPVTTPTIITKFGTPAENALPRVVSQVVSRSILITAANLGTRVRLQFEYPAALTFLGMDSVATNWTATTKDTLGDNLLEGQNWTTRRLRIEAFRPGSGSVTNFRLCKVRFTTTASGDYPVMTDDAVTDVLGGGNCVDNPTDYDWPAWSWITEKDVRDPIWLPVRRLNCRAVKSGSPNEIEWKHLNGGFIYVANP